MCHLLPERPSADQVLSVEPNLNVLLEDSVAEDHHRLATADVGRRVREPGDGQLGHGLLVEDLLREDRLQGNAVLASGAVREEDLKAETKDIQVDQLEGVQAVVEASSKGINLQLLSNSKSLLDVLPLGAEDAQIVEDGVRLAEEGHADALAAELLPN